MRRPQEGSGAVRSSALGGARGKEAVPARSCCWAWGRLADVLVSHAKANFKTDKEMQRADVLCDSSAGTCCWERVLRDVRGRFIWK